MSMNLLEVNLLRAPIQAVGLNRLVSSGRLNPVNSETIDRYASLSRAMKNAVRLATREGLKAYTVHRNRKFTPSGIATIIFGQVLNIEGEGRTKVYDLDYCLVKDASIEDHAEVANLLVNRGAKLAYGRDRAPVALSPDLLDVARDDASYNYCASIDPLNPAANRGFATMPAMRPVTGHFEGLGEDPDSIAKDVGELRYLLGHEIVAGNS